MKATLRAHVLERRCQLTVDERSLYDVSLSHHLHTLLTDLARESDSLTVAAHVPIGTEPGATVDFVDDISAIADTVLLPVCPPGLPAPLLWGTYNGALRTGRFGLAEPAGETRPPTALADADVVLLPALAADVTGMRLGRGAGYYDRSLQHATGLLVVVVHSGEVVESVPFDDHDRPADMIVTADGILTAGGNSGT